MNPDEQNKIAAFDTLFSTNHIQMLKILLPCLDHQMQKSLAVYIKFLELNYTITFYRRHPYQLCGCMGKNTPDIGSLCAELRPFCNEQEKKQLDQLSSLLGNIEMYREMAQTMELMKDILPEQAAAPLGGSSDGSGGFNIMELLTNMLTPEQKEMFELFGGNQNDG